MKLLYNVEEEKLKYRVIIIKSYDKITALRGRKGPITEPFAINLFTLKHILAEGHVVYAVHPFEGVQTRLTLQNYTLMYFIWDDLKSCGCQDLSQNNIALPEINECDKNKVLKVGKTSDQLSWAYVDWNEIVNKPDNIEAINYQNATILKAGLMSAEDKQIIENLDHKFSELNNEIKKKQTLVGSATENNIAVFDKEGQVKDIGINTEVLKKLSINNNQLKYDNNNVLTQYVGSTLPEKNNGTDIWIRTEPTKGGIVND